MALSTQMLDGLSPHVIRLLELRPGDEKLIKLAAQLEQRQQQQHRRKPTTQRLALAKSCCNRDATRSRAGLGGGRRGTRHAETSEVVRRRPGARRTDSTASSWNPICIAVCSGCATLAEAAAARCRCRTNRRASPQTAGRPATVAPVVRPWTKPPETTRSGLSDSVVAWPQAGAGQ